MSEHARRGAAPPLAPVRTAVLVTLMVVLTAASAWFGLYLLVTAGLAS